jgi:hypothetical protein
MPIRGRSIAKIPPENSLSIVLLYLKSYFSSCQDSIVRKSKTHEKEMSADKLYFLPVAFANPSWSSAAVVTYPLFNNFPTTISCRPSTGSAQLSEMTDMTYSASLAVTAILKTHPDVLSLARTSDLMPFLCKKSSSSGDLSADT